jgi:serine protease Do
MKRFNRSTTAAWRPQYTTQLWGLLLGLMLLLAASAALAQETALETLKESGKAFASVAKQVSPGVVFVRVEKTVEQRGPFSFAWPQGNNSPGDSPDGDLLRRFFDFPLQNSPPREEHVVGQGSGFLISRDGYILTNNHVVGDADKVTVTLEDGREFSAKTVGTDPHSDVAVIKIDADQLPALKLGDSDAVDVGEWVVAVGNPFGLSHTITAGIVSAKGRNAVGIADYENFIQTDAAINPGNSGGPLIDLDGNVIGMNTAIFSQSGGYMGIGFAIPINMAKAISGQLIENGSVTRGYLGIVIQNLTPELAETFGFKGEKGILVAQVNEDSPAARAGLKQGDVIVSFNGQPAGSVGDFRNRVALIAPGTKGTLTILRAEKRLDLTVTIGKLSEDSDQTRKSAETTKEYGLTVQDLTPDLAARLDLEGEVGVVVTQIAPGSAAERAGIQPGALIQEVNQERVRSLKDFQSALKMSHGDQGVLLLIKQGGFSRFIVLHAE